MNAPADPPLHRWLSIAACTAAALIISLPMLIRCARAGHGWTCEWIAGRNSQTDDTRQFVMMWEVSRVSIEDFGELPSWNPYHCGGVIHYLDPQVPFPGPLFFLLYFWVPAVVGIKLWNIAHLIAGALGARKLARDHGANGAEQLLAAVLVVGSSALAQHMGGGQLWFTPFLLMPWVLWSWERAVRDDARWAILLAALFALAALEGGVYPVPLMFAAVAFDALARLWRAADRRRLAKAAVAFAVLFPLLAAIKLVPVLVFLSGNPRLMPVDDRMTPREVLLAWITRDHARAVAGHIYVWPEYDAYIGVVPVVLLAAAFAMALARRDTRELPMRQQAFVVVALLWCALGDLPPLSLFSALHHLPIFRSLRVPSRFLYPATVMGAMLIVSLLVVVRRWAGARFAPWQMRAFAWLELLVAGFVLTDLSFATQAKLQQGGDVRVARRPASADFHLVANANYSEVPDFPVRGIGTTECYGGFDWSVSRALWTGRPTERLDPPDAGTVARVRWSPSAISFHAVLTRPATLLVDQNFDPGWRCNPGTPISHEGLLALRLPAGEHDVRFEHRPQGFWLGALLSLVGVSLSAVAVHALARRPGTSPFLRD